MLCGAGLEAEALHLGIQLPRRRVTQETTQIDGMLLRCGALPQPRSVLPLVDKLAWGDAGLWAREVPFTPVAGNCRRTDSFCCIALALPRAGQSCEASLVSHCDHRQPEKGV